MSLQKTLSMQSGLEESVAEKEEDDSKLNNFTTKEKIYNFFTNISVEPVMLCYTLPSVMASLATQNLNLEKACRVNLKFDDDVCTALANRNASGYNVTEEIAVQRLVATMSAWKNVIQSFIPAVLLMFLGSWSDRHRRRKPCMIFPIIGELVTSICFILCTYFFYELPMEVNALAEAIPPAITGGWFAMFMGMFSYISNITSLETRTLRIGAVNTVSSISVTIGIALSGILYKTIKLYGVFSLSVLLYAIAIVYTAFWLKEVPRDDLEKPEKEKSFLVDFFDLKHVKDTLKVAFKNGKRNRKKRICAIMVLVMVIIGPMHGEFSVLYLFARYKFGWNEIDYSLFSTFNCVLYMIGTAFNLAFFTKYLKLDDTVLGIVSNVCKISSSFIYALAPNTTVFYLGSIAEMFSGTSFIALRSIMSKLVPADELGKINSLFGVSEALMPLVYGPMYSLTYKMTIDWLPGFFFILGGILTIPAVIIFLWLYYEHKRDEKEDEMLKEQEAFLNQNKDMAESPAHDE